MPRPPVQGNQVHVAGPFRVRRIEYGADLVQPLHAHAGASVTLLLSGAIRETVGRRAETGTSLSVVVKPPGVRHSDEVGPGGARTLQVGFSAGAFEDLWEAGALGSEWRWLHGPRAARALLDLARAIWAGRAGPTELEGRALEALVGVGREPDFGGAGCPGWLRRVTEALEDDPTGRTSVRELARLVGVHPVSLSRAFQRELGLTVTEYRRRVRLRRAAALLTRSDGPISRVAHAAGYADHPHLCRELRELMDVSPSALRALASG